MKKDPKTGKSVRDYRRENELYNSRPEQKKARAERNTARAEMVKAGKASKGDGKDVDHKRPLSKGGTNAVTNLRTVSKTANRSFSRNSNGTLKSQRSKSGK